MKFINFISILEYIFCIHRNITSCNKSALLYKIIHIVCEITLFTINIVLHSTHEKLFICSIEKTFFFFNTLYSVVQIVLAACQSKVFVNFIKYAKANHSRCMQNYTYRQKIRRTQMNFLAGIVFLAAMQVGLFTYYRFFSYYDIPSESYTLVILFQMHLNISDYRYGLEFFIMYFYLNIISEQLEFMNKSVEKYVKVNKEIKGHATENQATKKQVKLCENWCILYSDIEVSSKLFNKSLGIQMTVMLALMLSSYVIFLYTLTSLSLSGADSVKGVITFVFISFYTCCLFFELSMLSSVAQKARHNAEKLRQQLGKLLLLNIEKESYKPVKDLLRLVSTRPVQTQAFGSISVDMTLLPSCVLFFTYNTIIALQFNNVV